MLLLRARQEDLRFLQYLPDVLECLNLELSRMAVLYALGYEEQLRNDGIIPETQSADDVRTFFRAVSSSVNSVLAPSNDPAQYLQR